MQLALLPSPLCRLVLRMRASCPRAARWAAPFRPSWNRSLQHNNLRHVRHDVAILPVLIPPTKGHWRSFSSTRPARFILDGDSTIYALSTAPGRAAIAVVRVSGPSCVSVWESIDIKLEMYFTHDHLKIKTDIQCAMPQCTTPETAPCSPSHPLRSAPVTICEQRPRCRRISPLLLRAKDRDW